MVLGMTLKKVSGATIISSTLSLAIASSGLAAVADAPRSPVQLQAHAQTRVHNDPFLRVFDEAKRALAERRYEAARGYIQAAMKQAQSPGDRSKRMLEATLLMGMLYIRTNQAHKAYNLLKDLERETGKAFGVESLEQALQLSELADSELALSKYKLAEQHAHNALDIFNKLSQETEAGGKAEYNNERGQAASRLAQALASQGFHEEAKPYFANAREYLTLSPGVKHLDLADELRLEGMFMHGIGQKRTSSSLFDKSCELQDQAANIEQPSHVLGEVRMKWEPGSPRCQEIIDNDFPLRCITTNKVRVAATTIDLWELMAVLVCVTNVDDHRRLVGIGNISLYKIESEPSTGQVKQISLIPTVDHHIIDRTRRELAIWSLTQDRPWLANMQKNRNVRGLVPSEGHDLFRGPNMFGVWGEWGGISHVVPTRVSVLPSRENVFDRSETDDLNHESGLILSEGARQAGLIPISLEPYESRTGELFYIYPRGEYTVNVQVNVGNVLFEFPFKTRKKRIR